LTNLFPPAPLLGSLFNYGKLLPLSRFSIGLLTETALGISLSDILVPAPYGSHNWLYSMVAGEFYWFIFWKFVINFMSLTLAGINNQPGAAPSVQTALLTICYQYYNNNWPVRNS